MDDLGRNPITTKAGYLWARDYSVLRTPEQHVFTDWQIQLSPLAAMRQVFPPLPMADGELIFEADLKQLLDRAEKIVEAEWSNKYASVELGDLQQQERLLRMELVAATDDDDSEMDEKRVQLAEEYWQRIKDIQWDYRERVGGTVRELASELYESLRNGIPEDADGYEEYVRHELENDKESWFSRFDQSRVEIETQEG